MHNMVPKLIGSKVVRQTTYIGQTPHEYVHIDMKLNFMHILAKLGFDGVYPIYMIKDSKACHRIYLSKYACTILSRTRGRYNLDQNTK